MDVKRFLFFGVPLSMFFLCNMAIPAYGTDVDISNLRDPFKYGSGRSHPSDENLPNAGNEGDKEIKVGLIMIVGKEKIAIIKGRQYKVGDMIDNYAIKSITLDYVDMENDNETKRIYVNENFE